MRRILTALTLLLVLCAPSTPVRAGDEDLAEALDGLSGAKALDMVKELAADGMKGRRTGFEGGTLVENWLIEKFSEFGLHPADAAGAYLEPFTFLASKVTAPIVFKLGEADLARGEDYVELTQTGGGDVDSAEVVFCGYGIERPDLGWNDYAKAQVKGKVVMAFRGAPPGREEDLKEERFIGYKSAKALEKGAVGFLLVEKEKAQGGTIIQRYARKDIPGLWISEALADRILAAKSVKLKALKKQMDEQGGGFVLATGAQVTLRVNVQWLPRAKGNNVLGAIRGRDPDLVDEVILVGAHMDHLGVGPDGTVFNGADDNASGTAVLAHLADVLTANRWRPKRTVIFCGFGAEEQGLVGSKTLAARYPFPGRVVCMLNMDMVGQGEPKVHIGGGGAYPTMQKHFETFLPADLKATTIFRPRSGPGSDQWPFYERGVPAFFIATKGPHPNYHSPKDDVEHIKPECLEAAARTVGSLIVRLGSHPEPMTDPMALPTYLVHEGPAFGRAALTKVGDRDAVVETPTGSGASALIVTIPQDLDPQAAWQRLEALAKPKGSPFLLVRKADDIRRAWRGGKRALLPRLCCNKAAHENPASLTKLAGLGYRWLVPWQSGTNELVFLHHQAAAIAAACRDTGALLDVAGAPPESWGAIRGGLRDRPALFLVDPALFLDPNRLREGFAEFKPLGRETLGINTGPSGGLFLGSMILDDVAERPRWTSLLDDSAEAASWLSGWGKRQPTGWDLPGSPQRKAIRAALGGRLVEWLRRAER